MSDKILPNILPNMLRLLSVHHLVSDKIMATMNNFQVIFFPSKVTLNNKPFLSIIFFERV